MQNLVKIVIIAAFTLISTANFNAKGQSIDVACFEEKNNVVSLMQETEQPKADAKSVWRTENTSINFGVLMGGGGLVGLDFELLAYKHIGIQLGAGIGSIGAGINYHFKPHINSQFISIQYFHQGLGDNHFGSYIGPMYVFRAKKIFQAGIGFGTILSKGPKWNLDKDMSMMLLYNIGLYFPF